jgi:3-hydroxyacyl-[acyl-carrier-protein] dehydratase
MQLEYFQMVDRIESVDPAAGLLVANCAVPETSPVFEGHFPDYPLLPGVLMIESMAQASGWLLLALHRFARMPFLAQVREAKLRTFVGPGEHLVAEARLVHDGSGYAVTSGKLRSASKTVAEAEITLRAVPFPRPALRERMLETARRVGLPAEYLDGA